jgi:4-hydroxy-3-polyprenylbenzoate decarboxylase
MTALSEMGAIIAPPVPAFYARPASVQDIVDHSVGRVLDLFGLETDLVGRWGEPPDEGGEAGPRPKRSRR